MKTKIATCMIILSCLAGCKESSGIKEVDRISNDVVTASGIQTDITPVVKTARKAVETAEAAGRTGNAAEMGKAVSQGTGQVLCAAVENSKEIGDSVAKDVAQLDKSKEKTTAQAYAELIEQAPEFTLDCGD